MASETPILLIAGTAGGVGESRAHMLASGGGGAIDSQAQSQAQAQGRLIAAAARRSVSASLGGRCHG
ncbi:hypothetical protein SAMN06296416_101553 [Pseudoxanthomonas wuyuanensis]|uniref:Uncharacterized protein n=1 Tax=Pseudoxanthomonas wuyuanensis TaxID=1073196 RepID=A0A286CY34_9GAMM|nr:hypothetical protein SAMN06296416_101553 [Pseudoxanthomonas wuyuanensis]